MNFENKVYSPHPNIHVIHNRMKNPSILKQKCHTKIKSIGGTFVRHITNYQFILIKRITKFLKRASSLFNLLKRSAAILRKTKI